RLRRDQAARLEARGVPTLAALAEAPDDARPPQMHPATFESLRDQAAMQLAARGGTHRTKVLPVEPGRGFSLLPPPSPGHLFFDIEGDRSEEHTSELQSRSDLVCRLLLEKKNARKSCTSP